MKHIVAFILKTGIVAIILEIVLGYWTALTFTQILMISLAVTFVAYIVGDILVLPATNNTIATLADIGLAFAVIYLFNFVYTPHIRWMDALIAGFAVGVGEILFHRYMSRMVLPG